MPLCVAQFELSYENNLAEAKCLVDGIRQITAAAITEEIATLRLSFEKADWQTTQFAFDELATTSSNISVPIIKTATVPLVSPYQIVDTGISATTSPGIQVYRASSTATLDRSFMLTQTAAPTTAEQVQIDVTNTALVFTAANAGATIQYSIAQPFTSIPTIGLATTADKFGTLEFIGKVYNSEFSSPPTIRCPRIYRTGTPSISIAGDVSTLDVEFRAGVPDGGRKAVQWFNTARGV